jgi:hypothetical protein
LLEIDQEHLPGLEAAASLDLFGGHLEHAGLRSHHHQPIFGDEPARGAQTIAVENGADLLAVGEGERRRAIPGLHETRVVLVEIPLVSGHQIVVLPGLGHQHHHHVRHAAARLHQQLHRVVQTAGVAVAGADHRQDVIDIFAEDVIAIEDLLARPHPGGIAAQRIDLAVVRQHPERLRQFPGGEGIGAEALVHHGQGAHHAGVVQIEIEGAQLLCPQQALVHDRARR